MKSTSVWYPLSRLVQGPVALVFVLICVGYLLWGTGFATDDYVHFLNGISRSASDYLLPKEYVSVPVLHYTHALAYYVIGDRIWVYDLLKSVYVGIGVYFSSKFFLLFCPPRQSLVLAFLFIFFPLHDGATFWLTGLYLALSFSAYLYAYALGSAGSTRLAIIFAFLGSFSSYGSTPIALGLAFLALLQRKRSLATKMILPNVIYITYYSVTSLIFGAGTQRLTEKLNILGIGDNFFLQVASFIDAAFGPSAWSKIYYSISALDSFGVMVSLMMAVVFLGYLRAESRSRVSRNLLISAIFILALSLVMFSLTGLYPQLTFNLGNRVMIYGGFFFVCLLAVMRLPRDIELVVIGLLLFSINGISVHWKDWHKDLQQLGGKVRESSSLRKLEPGTKLFVSGHQYSQLGPYCHIDFFTADYVVQKFIQIHLNEGSELSLASFNRRLVLEDGGLRDRKYGDLKPVGDEIWVYDSERNLLELVPRSEIPTRLKALPDETRHWTQQLEEGWLKQRLLEAVPRLRYAY